MGYQEKIKSKALSDDRIIVMTAENRAVLRELPPILGKRFVDTGITEQTMIGMAAGLAKRGKIPICHALACFLTMRAFEFIRTDIGISNLPVKLSGFIPGILSDANGPTHQAIEDVSLMRGIPNMEVYVPADSNDMVMMLDHIWESDKPSYLRLNHIEGNYIHEKYHPGKAEIIYEINDINILVYGNLFYEALELCKLMNKEGFSTGLINLRSLQPIDKNTLFRVLESGSIVITIEDHFLIGGLYSILSEFMVENRFNNKVIPFAFKNKWFKPALLDRVLIYEGLKGKQMFKHVKKKI